MRKFLAILVAVTIVLLLPGCGILMMRDNWEKSNYEDTITALFSALDSGDRDGVASLFSSYAREQDKNLEADIEKLFSVYRGPMDEIGWDGLLAGSYTNHYGERESSVYAHFPVRCADTYYWCDLELMYENSVDASQIGVTQLSFYTADEWCINCYDDNAEWCDEVGLSVIAERTLEEEIRCISGSPYKYAPSEKVLDIDKVKSFFEKSNSYSEFVAQFGEPNAENSYCYYELPPEDGNVRYLGILYDDDGVIYHASIEDHFAYLDTIYDEE